MPRGAFRLPSHPRAALLAVVLASGAAGGRAADMSPAAPDGSALMPRVGDFTLMGWAAEFPGHTPAAPWRRVIRTGSYAMALDTETLRVPHFGAVPTGSGYVAAAAEDPAVWRDLPPASLELTITAGGTRHRCTAGG